MKKIKHWLDRGFVKVAKIYESDRLTQGVDVEFFVDKKEYEKPGVYLLVHRRKILKIGQSANITDRIFKQYKCVTNRTNNRIREEVKERYKKVEVYAFRVPREDFNLIGYTFPINYQKGLEEAMLRDYYRQYNTIPPLNIQLN